MTNRRIMAVVFCVALAGSLSCPRPGIYTPQYPGSEPPIIIDPGSGGTWVYKTSPTSLTSQPAKPGRTGEMAVEYSRFISRFDALFDANKAPVQVKSLRFTLAKDNSFEERKVTLDFDRTSGTVAWNLNGQAYVAKGCEIDDIIGVDPPGCEDSGIAPEFFGTVVVESLEASVDGNTWAKASSGIITPR